MKDLINHCESSYSFSAEDKGDYSKKWETSINTLSNSRKRRDNYWVVNSTGGETRTSRKRRNIATLYQQMPTGRKSSLRRNKIKSNAEQSIYYVVPEALLPDGSVVSCADRWQHFSSSELNGFPFVGRLVTYDGGGYVANLGYNEETAWTVIADLHANSWLDKQTRAVFVEFTVYNANVNLFATAFLFIEVLPTGGAFPWADFKVFNGYRYSLDSNLSSRLFELVFTIFVIYFTVRELRLLLKQRVEYLKSFFNLIEILLLPLYIVMFTLIIYRWLSTARNIKEFKENPKDFVSFQYSAAADSTLQAVIGVIAFLLNIKFLRLFQFAKSFYRIALIMKSFAYPLAMFTIPFTLYFLLFAFVAHLGFGSQSEHYQSMMRTCVTQFLHLLGATDFEEIKLSNPMFGPFYFLAYSIFMMNIVFNVFMVIICEAIDGDYEEELMASVGDIQMADYLMRQFKDLFGIEYEEDIEPDGEDLLEEKYTRMDDKMTELENRVSVLFEKFDAIVIQEDIAGDEKIVTDDNEHIDNCINESTTSLRDNSTEFIQELSNSKNDEETDSDGEIEGSRDLETIYL